MIRIVLFGTPHIAVTIFESLLQDSDFEIVACVSQPDKPVGRKQLLTSTPVSTWAKNNNLLLKCPIQFKSLENIDWLQSLKADIFLVVAFGKIFSEKILHIPRYGCINVHTSLLPKYRGASPIQHALLNQDRMTGVTLMKMDSGLDTGDIFFQTEVQTQSMQYTELEKTLAQVTSQYIGTQLKKFCSGNIVFIPQDESKATFCKKIEKQDGYVDIKETSCEVMIGKFRAFYLWPKIYSIINGKRIIWHEIIQIYNKKIAPGQIIWEKNHLYLGMKNGTIEVKSLQIEGKNKGLYKIL